jgi:DNA-binding beta-propeller fold protein YncE
MAQKVRASKWLGALVLAVGMTFVSSASAAVMWGNQPVTSFGTEGAIGGFPGFISAAVDPSTGEVYVTDNGNAELQVFSSSGKFIAAWGWGTNADPFYQVCTSSCEGAIPGSGLGQFEAPVGVAVDPLTQDVYVIDGLLDRIDEFTATGKPIRYFGSVGSGNGEMDNPAGGFAFDPATNQLLLADTVNNRVEAFTPSGKYVSDAANNRIEQFNRSKAFIAAWGAGVSNGADQAEICTSSCRAGVETGIDGGFSGPGGLAIDPTDGSVYVADFRNERVERLSAGGHYQSQFASASPNLLALDPANGDVYVAGETTLAKYSAGGGFLTTFGSSGAKAGQFMGPHGVAVNPKTGDVYVTDYANHRLDVFGSSGKFLAAWGWGVKDGRAKSEVCTSSCRAGISGSSLGQLDGPLGVAVDPTNGTVFVSDYVANKIQEFNSSGTPVQTLGQPGSDYGELEHPEGLAYDPWLNDVVVADAGNNRIDLLNVSYGTEVSMFGWGVLSGDSGELDTCGFAQICLAGQSGAGNGEFKGPTAVAVASNGTIYVADSGNNRVQLMTYSTAASFDAKWGGAAGSGPGEFNNPQAVAIDPNDGNVYVSDFNNGRVEELTASGDYLSDFGSAGTRAGQFLDGAAGLAIAPSGTLYAVDYQGNRFDEFGVPAKPSCAGHTVSVRDSKTIKIKFACHTPSGITPLYALQSKPRRGTVSAFNAAAATVSYKAPRNYAGTVSLRIGATDDDGAATTTIKVKVRRPPKRR